MHLIGVFALIARDEEKLFFGFYLEECSRERRMEMPFLRLRLQWSRKDTDDAQNVRRMDICAKPEVLCTQARLRLLQGLRVPQLLQILILMLRTRCSHIVLSINVTTSTDSGFHFNDEIRVFRS